MEKTENYDLRKQYYHLLIMKIKCDKKIFKLISFRNSDR